ncbi:MAG: hypothetical protein R2709_12970 [Marmoricola sp.]
MRIALIHSYCSSRVPSGENNVVDAQLATLRAAGHEVQLIEQQTDARLARKTYPVEAALTVASGVGPSPLRQLLDFDPDALTSTILPEFRSPLVDEVRRSARGDPAQLSAVVCQGHALPGWTSVHRMS